ncbi:Hexaprenyl-diphosphate synthase large subunit ((2E,6E)-farnesyl-diphosphate specific) [Streptomyces sp. ADI97-07]|uniref:polyprenyl synthetase family protein n=1 Tax=Streptomyces sp. ADI97-07 TaxID=1522762 RepID=UPI000F54D870|nr:polyprenyl synthetase family protein [Streptomyces sp. ADI97-07]RPK85151.1 Hexaprenyl-diphosphate synthase large subunit ((2E,6E)-farnesyl-diphosphate specific) [Streptomyces sp. ADI97-07]
MARTQAVEHSSDEHPPPAGPVGTGRVAAPHAYGPGPDDGPPLHEAGAVDADVVGAVLRTARTILGERVREASELDPSFSDDLARRVADFTLEGGKRIRPRLVWWGMRACGGGDAASVEAALRMGVALELIQTCALVHDDVMDRSRLRRGRPAVHIGLATRAGLSPDSEWGASYGTSAAVLVGDLALAWADDTVADTTPATSAHHRIRTIWRAMRTEMVAGQYLDLHGQVTGGGSAARAIRTACLKSALYSVERPLAIGAALAGADERTTAALRSAARAAGIAFQLRDDLLGVFGDPAQTGKPSGDDIREGKPTYLLAVARTRAAAADDKKALAVLDGAVGNGELTREGLAAVRGVFDATGARAHVERNADRLGEHAARRLAETVDVRAQGGRQLLELLRTISAAPVHSAPAPAASGARGGAPPTGPPQGP